MVESLVEDKKKTNVYVKSVKLLWYCKYEMAVFILLLTYNIFIIINLAKQVMGHNIKQQQHKP